MMLSNLNRREDALKASEEAVDIHRALAKDRPDVFRPDLARSLNNISVDYSNLNRREDALKASEEAVDIRRALAKDRPDVFRPDLARSLSVMSDVLAAMGRHAEAAATAQEALATLAPYVERYPETYAGLARTIRSDVLQYGKAGRVEPDGVLLQRVAQTLGADNIATAASAPAASDGLQMMRAHPAPSSGTRRGGSLWALKLGIAIVLVLSALAALAITGLIDVGDIARRLI